jgi:hypothetical protein
MRQHQKEFSCNKANIQGQLQVRTDVQTYGPTTAMNPAQSPATAQLRLQHAGQEGGHFSNNSRISHNTHTTPSMEGWKDVALIVWGV